MLLVVCRSVCLSVFLPFCLCVCRLVCWFVCLFVFLFVNQLVCVFVCLVFCSFFLILCVGACACVCASACLCASICVHVSVCACAGVRCLGLVVPLAFEFYCNNIAAPAQQQHCNKNSSIAAATLQQHCSNSSKNIGPTVGKWTNPWAIDATNSQSLVTHMVWGPWGPKTHGIHNFPCVLNDKQTYSTFPKGLPRSPPKCSLCPLPFFC